MKYKIILISVIFLTLCSCKTTREIDEQSIVSAMAFEWREEVTVKTEILAVSIDEQNISTRIFEGSGKTPQEAIKSLDSKLPKRLLFDHCAAIIIPPDTEKAKRKELLFFCIDEPTINMSTPVVCSKDISSLFEAEHESAAVGYDIMQILRHTGLEEESRLYKTAINSEHLQRFENENGKVVKK